MTALEDNGMRSLALTSVAALVGACVHPVEGADRTTVLLRDADGRNVGRVSFEQVGSDLRLSVTVSRMAAGQHGVHIHAI